MSLTKDVLEKHLKDPAIFCCRRQKGLVISGADLEDPDLFEDMTDAGLLTLSSEGLTIEQVLGRTLTADTEALTPITAAMLDGVNEEEPEKKKITEENPEKSVPAATPVQAEKSEKIIRTLKKRIFKVKDAEISCETSFGDGKLTIDEKILEKAIKADPLVKNIKIDVIKPQQRHIYTDTIMDVCPIAAKAEGKLGEGITNVIEGAVFMLTGVDEDGTQIHEFGSSEGYLDEKMFFGHPGCADPDDIIIRVETVIQSKTGMERRGPYAAHKCEDVVIQAVRDVLKKTADIPEREEICRDIH